MIFFAGPHGAGKTHASKLFESAGFESIDLGPTIRRLHAQANSGKSLHKWVVENEKESGADFTDFILAEEVKKLFSENQNLLILGSRSYNNIKYINDYVGGSITGSTIVYIEAPKTLLKERWESRESRNLSDEEFDDLLKRDSNMGLEAVRDHAHFIVNNEGSEEEFSAKMNELLSKLKR